jgi:hypothetical protein
VLVSITLVFILLRIYVRFHTRKPFSMSDVFVILAWIAFASCCTCDIKLNEYGLFSPGRTYNDSLITLNSDPNVVVQGLKVCLLKHWLIPARIWIRIAILYRFMADQSLPPVLLLRIYPFQQKTHLHATQISDCVHIGYISHRYRIKRLLLPTNVTELVFPLTVPSDRRSLDLDQQCLNSPNLGVFLISALSNIVTDLMSMLPHGRN